MQLLKILCRRLESWVEWSEDDARGTACKERLAESLGLPGVMRV